MTLWSQVQDLPEDPAEGNGQDARSRVAARCLSANLWSI